MPMATDCRFCCLVPVSKPDLGPACHTQVPGKSELQQLLAGRCRSRTDPPTAASVFRSLGLRDPQQYTAGNSNSTTVVSEADVWGSVRQLLLAGEQVAAAQRVVAGVRRLIDSGRRVTLTAPEWEAAWTALNRCAGLHRTAPSQGVYTVIWSLRKA